MSTSESPSHKDLSLGYATCEVRYDPAYLIFDRTGAICLESREHYPDLKITAASPTSTSFSGKGYTFTVEQACSRAMLNIKRHDPKEFGEMTSHFFEIVLRLLDVRVLTRIGLRQGYFKAFSEHDDGGSAVKALTLQHVSSDNYFGLPGESQELIMRWESSEVGAMLHVVPVPGTLALAIPDVLKIEGDAEKKYKSAIVFDVDYYTLAPTYRTQWSSQEWIAQSSHVIKKGIRSLLQQ